MNFRTESHRSDRFVFVSGIIVACLMLSGCNQTRIESILRVDREDLTEVEYLRRKQSLASLIKSPTVLSAALADPEISQLSLLKAGANRDVEERRSKDFLDKKIGARSLGDSELIRTWIYVPSGKIEEGRKILDAVVESFFSKIVNQEKAERARMLDQLRSRSRSLLQKMELTHEEAYASQRYETVAQSERELLNHRLRLLEEHALKVQLEQVRLLFDSNSPPSEPLQWIEKQKKEALDRLSSIELPVSRTDVKQLQYESMGEYYRDLQRQIFSQEQKQMEGDSVKVISRAEVPE